jgi:hypothetical protein
VAEWAAGGGGEPGGRGGGWLATLPTERRRKKREGKNGANGPRSGATASRRDYSSSSPKKNWLAQSLEQKMRPYSCRPHSSQTHLKQIGHLWSDVSISLFWQALQFIA